MSRTPNPPAEAASDDVRAANIEDFEFGSLAAARNYRLKLIDEFRPHLRGDLLEVGGGIGQITEQLTQLAEVQRLVVVEPNRNYEPKLNRLKPRAEIVIGTTSSLPANAAFDSILCVNVLEHIEDHAGELARHRRLLEERRGHLCLFVPARPEIYAPIDRDFGHFRRYRRKELADELHRAGFEIVRLRYYNLVGYFGWWWHFKVNGGKRFDPRAVRFFDRAIFPVMNKFERAIVAPPLGQSLLAIARPR